MEGSRVRCDLAWIELRYIKVWKEADELHIMQRSWEQIPTQACTCQQKKVICLIIEMKNWGMLYPIILINQLSFSILQNKTKILIKIDMVLNEN